MTKKTAHIISHTHWDREWYMPYEYHHALLIELMDTLLDTLEHDPGFKSFHLDGQTIMLEDYLQVRPEMKGKLEKYIHEGRIHIGPWYILQDEFLTSSEANVRNLQIGHRDCAHYGGHISKVGYFPDSFGNMGQAPQMLKQANIDVAVFGRGVKPTGFNNQVSEDAAYESPFSEMIWQSPDGSRVIGILFANWYCNGMEVPVEEKQAVAYWEKNIENAEKFASTNHLLFMNGCDHQPIQTDLSKAIEVAKKLFPDVDFVHSNFNDYVDELKQELPENLQTIQGELRSQRTDGWYTLVNTASSRVYLKQMNAENQTLLEKVAEPLAAFAHQAGKPYPHHLFVYAWKTLMQNHPHDSICGCSVDEVHREMVTRFEKSKHMTEMIINETVDSLLKQIDTTVYNGKGAVPFTVFNTAGYDRSGVVEVKLELSRRYFREGHPTKLAAEMKQEPIVPGAIVDADGNVLDCQWEDAGVTFGYDLPKDKFRQPYMARSINVRLQAKDIPAFGYQTLAWVPGAAKEQSAGLVTGEFMLENDHLKAQVAEDGSLTLTDKKTGHTHAGLNVYEDAGDIGNEYMFRMPEGSKPLTTAGLKAERNVVENTPFRAVIEVTHHWSIPVSADDTLKQEQLDIVDFPKRKAQRSTEMAPFHIVTRYTLDRGAKRVDVHVTMDNQSKDHRVRALFPSGFTAETHLAESIFEVARRNNVPAQEWENPSNDQHQHTFVSVSDGNLGLTVANKGLFEYEVSQDNKNTIAVTLLRSSGELGDWGYFPTPEAQCIGTHTAEYAIIPHAGDAVAAGVHAEAHSFQVPWIVRQVDVHEGCLPANHAYLAWEGEGVAFSSIKMAEETGDMVGRWFNVAHEGKTLNVRLPEAAAGFYRSNILEHTGDSIASAANNQDVAIQLGSAEIFTLGIKK
ncbi:alpha-mannosidase [Paenibacillus apiarius]|uniref:Alpha-mannosidase n=1 Tax=Paenibacillus apiarius TaxID=46240 RepID=A0ABT4DNK1_9BACL|nr:alpha-mannosidase [Paenibacillus apiarius]MCY9515525.1 alpha-mannosidase [Paenibacillus apiarius]MCY9518934.1 alpha-mannosidase [Paenibacillus apiarius]MCY9552020.1 alpha-mannosidase [Paenibacillus apiarius]MCY9557304.1 alpha-mannosidase [Paenibacillus apiarius]MCY9682517.1 alpha-mannosidase [Paenibacillus apiarius]